MAEYKLFQDSDFNRQGVSSKQNPCSRFAKTLAATIRDHDAIILREAEGLLGAGDRASENYPPVPPVRKELFD